MKKQQLGSIDPFVQIVIFCLKVKTCQVWYSLLIVLHQYYETISQKKKKAQMNWTGFPSKNNTSFVWGKRRRRKIFAKRCRHLLFTVYPYFTQKVFDFTITTGKREESFFFFLFQVGNQKIGFRVPPLLYIYIKYSQRIWGGKGEKVRKGKESG